jgi:hypothetical protein
MRRLPAVVACFVALALAAGCADKTKIYTRDELRNAVIGKSVEDVRRMMGDPDGVETGDPDPDRGYLIYKRRTKDDRGAVDAAVFVWYARGRVNEVTW